jgi:hypothetical protein
LGVGYLEVEVGLGGAGREDYLNCVGIDHHDLIAGGGGLQQSPSSSCHRKCGVEITCDIYSLVKVDKHGGLSVDIGDVGLVGEAAPACVVAEETSSTDHWLVFVWAL